jgi:hypothetical protein
VSLADRYSTQIVGGATEVTGERTMRKINDMFHIDGERLVKNSNGHPVPEDEPIFILRGRDALAHDTILAYIHLCESADPPVPSDRIQQLNKVANEFFRFPAQRLKTPGSTHGK